jgi:hypothetical protein
MAHDIFISHASADAELAVTICELLESEGVSCWIAPRDITPGTAWATAIVNAIAVARGVILLLTHSSNSSPTVAREIERASSKGIPILPVRLEAIPPSAELELFVAGTQWIDATTGEYGRLATEISDIIQSVSAPSSDGARQAVGGLRGAGRTARQTRDNEVTFSHALAEAFACVYEALGRLGRVTESDEEQYWVMGRVWQGLQRVKVRVSVVQDVPGRSRAVIQASSDDFQNRGAQRVTARLVEVLLNLNNPGYRPDRLGVHPLALVFGTLGFLGLLYGVLWYALPRILGW